MGSFFVACIALYRFAISPLLPRTCRFAPTCSHYAIEAVRRYGPGKGIVLALLRIARCNPWVSGGFDPVPPPRLPPRKGSSLCR
jgi:putative membrane protein insertion efficiency factor